MENPKGPPPEPRADGARQALAPRRKAGQGLPRWLTEPLLVKFRTPAAQAAGARAALRAPAATPPPRGFGAWVLPAWGGKLLAYGIACIGFVGQLFLGGIALLGLYQGAAPPGWLALPLVALAFGFTGAIDGYFTYLFLSPALSRRLPRLRPRALRRGLVWGLALGYPFCLLLPGSVTAKPGSTYVSALALAGFALAFGLLAGGGLGWALYRAARSWRALALPILAVTAGALLATLPLLNFEHGFGWLLLTVPLFPGLPLALMCWALFRTARRHGA